MNDKLSKFLDALSDLAGEHKVDVSVTMSNFAKGYMTVEFTLQREDD